MLVLDKIESVQRQVFEWKAEGLTVGFVPTMGSLHQGHLELVKTSQNQCDRTVVSIFVNATQFNDASDFEKYPRDLATDVEMLEGLSDLVFAPSHEEMYPSGLPQIKMNFGSLETVMEGRFRPGHFNGVGIVVSKLFNVVQPDVAVFGQKDIQQFAIIQQLVQDLSFPIKLICNPIIRDGNGLALSSRNKRLSEKGRLMAASLNKTIQRLAESLQQGDAIETSKQLALQLLAEETDITLDYLEVANAKTLETVLDFSQGDELVICIAAFLEEVRLIDNRLITI